METKVKYVHVCVFGVCGRNDLKTAFLELQACVKLVMSRAAVAAAPFGSLDI